MLRNILTFLIAILLSYFVGYIAVYNTLIQGRDLSQIRWQLGSLFFFLIIGILTIVLRCKRGR